MTDARHPPTRLSKERSRERWAQLRALWREYDPIGVYSPGSGCPPDEYDRYVGGTMRLLETAAEVAEIVSYLREACEETMGLPVVPEAHYAAFASKLTSWYTTDWPGTVS